MNSIPKYSDTCDQYRAEIDGLRIRLASMAGECHIYDEMLSNERKENDMLNAKNVALREENAKLRRILGDLYGTHKDCSHYNELNHSAVIQDRLYEIESQLIDLGLIIKQQ